MSNPERKPTDGDWKPHDDEIPIRLFSIGGDLSPDELAEIHDAIFDAAETIDGEILLINGDIESVSKRELLEALDE